MTFIDQYKQFKSNQQYHYLIKDENNNFYNEIKKYLPPSFDEYFFQITVRFEKQKENVYQRSYKNLTQIISEIGGFAQAILAFGYVICTRLSSLDLSKTIINDAFNFQTDTKDHADFVLKNNSGQSAQPNLSRDIRLAKQKPEKDNSQGEGESRDVSQMKMSKIKLNSTIQQCSPQLSFIKQEPFQFAMPSDLEQSNFNKTRLLSSAKDDSLNPSPLHQHQSFKNLNNVFSSQDERQGNVITAQSPQLGSQQIRDKVLSHSFTQKENSGKLSSKGKLTGKLKGVKKNNNYRNQLLLGQIIQNKKTQQNNHLLTQEVELSQQQRQQQQQQRRRSTIKDKSEQQQYEEELSENKFKKLYKDTTNSMKISISEYIKYFFWPFGQVKRKKQIIDYSLNRLYEHLDVLNVIKKLLEVDKLKKLLMDSEQIKLFEYLPKPTIRDEDVFPTINVQGEFDAVYSDTRTEIQKLQDACKAYLHVQNRESKTSIDRKLVNLLDPHLVHLFNIKLDNHDQDDVELILHNQEQKTPSNVLQISKIGDEIVEENYLRVGNNFNPQLLLSNTVVPLQNQSTFQEDLVRENSISSDVEIPVECKKKKIDLVNITQSAKLGLQQQQQSQL